MDRNSDRAYKAEGENCHNIPKLKCAPHFSFFVAIHAAIQSIIFLGALSQLTPFTHVIGAIAGCAYGWRFPAVMVTSSKCLAIEIRPFAPLKVFRSIQQWKDVNVTAFYRSNHRPERWIIEFDGKRDGVWHHNLRYRIGCGGQRALEMKAFISQVWSLPPDDEE